MDLRKNKVDLVLDIVFIIGIIVPYLLIINVDILIYK